MAWSASAIFRQMVADTFAGTQVQDLNSPSDTYKVTLWDNDITPDKDVSAANSAYGAGQWVSSGNEVSDGSEWTVGGMALSGLTITTPSSGVIMCDATDLASGSSATLANVYGTMTYNDTDTTPVADPGIVYNYLGGTNSVTDGTLTIVWHANGLFRITV